MESFLKPLLDAVNNLTRYFEQQSATAGIVGIISAAALAPVAYHLYMLHQFSGEAKVAFSWFPYLGHAIEFGMNPLKLIQKLSTHASGKVCEITGLVLAGKRIFLINDPNSFKMIFKSKKEVNYSNYYFHYCPIVQHNNVSMQMSFDVFTRKIVIDVFGGTPECTNGVHAAAEPSSRASYNKFLLSEEGCALMTERMQRKIAELVSALPQENTVEMVKFFCRFIYTASAAALFTDEFAESDELFESFTQFDSVFALLVAGAPEFSVSQGIRGA
jgi:hypothetical protein